MPRYRSFHHRLSRPISTARRGSRESTPLRFRGVGARSINAATSLDQPADISRINVHQTRGEVSSNLGSHRNDGPVNLIPRELNEPILVGQYCGPPTGGVVQLGGSAPVGSVELGELSLGVSHGVTQWHRSSSKIERLQLPLPHPKER
jgi:hypothetical protein